MNKHFFGSDGYETYDEAIADVHKGLQALESNPEFKVKKLNERIIEIPPNARDMDGFMAVIRISDEFNIYEGEEAKKRMGGEE